MMISVEGMITILPPSDIKSTDRTSPLHCCLMPTMMLLTVGKEMFMLLDSLKMFAKIGEYAFISTA
jgi:hypothetical protein